MDKRIDFHCHVLPGADHGSSCVETSVNQIRLQKDAGISTIVATPHFYPEQTSVKSFLSMRESCAEQLKAALPQERPTIYLGAEVLVCPGLDQLEGIEQLCIKGTKTILLEMPFSHFGNAVLYAVEELARSEMTIVMAHIDRYDIEDVDELMCLPVLAQVNAASLLHGRTRRDLERYFVADRIVAFGTDLHGDDEKSIQKYLKGLSKIGEYNEEIINGFTEKMISGAIPL